MRQKWTYFIHCANKKQIMRPRRHGHLVLGFSNFFVLRPHFKPAAHFGTFSESAEHLDHTSRSSMVL